MRRQPRRKQLRLSRSIKSLPAVIADQYTPIMAKITAPCQDRARLNPESGNQTGAGAGREAAGQGRSRSASRSAQTKPARRTWTSAEVYEAFSRFRNANPEPKGELEHLNPYTLLVAVVLSAQATDAGVNKATRALFAVADTPEKMLALGEDAVRDYIKTDRALSQQGQERHRAVARS